jgi:hypothetical protein
VLAQDALDQHRSWARTFSRSVQSMVTFAHRLDQLAGDAAQRLVAQHLHRAVVGLQRVVETPARPRSAQRLAARVPASRISFASAISSSITCAASIARFW